MKMGPWTKRVLAALLCLGLFCSSAYADVDNPYEEENGQIVPAFWEDPPKDFGIQFPDVSQNADYAEAVSTLAGIGIITGDEKGNFNPSATITRGETAAIVCRMLGVEEDAKIMKNSVFNDVPASHWAVGYVAKASELGIINGYGDGNFGPGNSVTYEQIVKMLVCAWGYEEEAKAAGGWPNGYLSVADSRGISEGLVIDATGDAVRSTVAMLCYNTMNIARGNFSLEN